MGNKRSASGESGDDAFIDAFLNGAHLPAGDNTGSSNSPSSSTTVIGRDGKPVRNEGNVTGAKDSMLKVQLCTDSMVDSSGKFVGFGAGNKPWLKCYWALPAKDAKKKGNKFVYKSKYWAKN